MSQDLIYQMEIWKNLREIKKNYDETKIIYSRTGNYYDGICRCYA